MADTSLRNLNYFDVPETLDCPRCDGWGALWGIRHNPENGEMSVYRHLDEDPCSECLGNGLDHFPITEFYNERFLYAHNELR